LGVAKLHQELKKNGPSSRRRRRLNILRTSDQLLMGHVSEAVLKELSRLLEKVRASFPV
jgi:hypothetical protein